MTNIKFRLLKWTRSTYKCMFIRSYQIYLPSFINTIQNFLHKLILNSNTVFVIPYSTNSASYPVDEFSAHRTKNTIFPENLHTVLFSEVMTQFISHIFLALNAETDQQRTINLLPWLSDLCDGLFGVYETKKTRTSVFISDSCFFHCSLN